MLPLAPRQVEQKRAEGALLVDVRTDQQFDDAHIPGSVCNPMLRAGFGSKLAWLADREQEIVFIGRDDEDGRRAAGLAVAVGLRRLGGYLHGGMTSWRQEKRPVEEIERLPGRGARPQDVQILDVREERSGTRATSPARSLTPWHDVDGVPDGLDPGRPIAVDLRLRPARRDRRQPARRAPARAHVIHVVDGGVPAWERLGRPIETG